MWKAAKPGEPAWDSPWGLGRPGWHIECSAMGLRYLGAGFDVHGGGRDLIFPHHENEIAQSEAAGLPFARIWMHNGMIRSEGEKMAKSVGNIFLLREVLDRYEPSTVLMYFLTTHYRSPLEFSVEKLEEAKAAYGRITDALADFEFRIENAARAAQQGEWPDLTLRAEAARLRFAEHMDDDLNTAGAFGELFALIAETRRYLAAVDRGEAPLDAEALVAVCEVLRESLERAPGAAAGRRRSRRPRPATSPGTTRRRAPPASVALAPAARLAEEEPLGRRGAGLRGPALVRRRVVRLRAAATTCAARRTGPAPTASATSCRRPASRCATRRRAPRSCAAERGPAQENRVRNASDPTMPPATAQKTAAQPSFTWRGGGGLGRVRLVRPAPPPACGTSTSAASARHDGGDLERRRARRPPPRPRRRA